MGTQEIVPPEPQLMESMRAVGYTLEAAIADLIDNSVTADATQIDLLYTEEHPDTLAVVDNGHGMSEAQAREAMRLAGQSATAPRSQHDLGRFGLGLKTASLSQCRDLVLLSKDSRGDVSGFRWNLDHLAQEGKWALIHLDHREVVGLPYARRLLDAPSGTLVLWRQLDQLRAQTGDGTAAIDRAIVSVKSHLSLVFHRYLAGEHGRPFSIRVNYNELQQIDPFLKNHRSTQRSAPEHFEIEGQRIDVQAFTLPLISRLSAADRRTAQVAGRLRDSQGFYIYRGMRLVIWGTWFRILPREELGKLARVQVDIPNTLDHLWALDIKKSAALPPPEVRARLKRIADRIIQPSKRVHLFRGRPEPSTDDVRRIWQLFTNGAEFRYEIDRGHPLLNELSIQLNAAQQRSLSDFLTLVENSFPSQDLFNRLGQDNVQRSTHADITFVHDLAVRLWSTYKAHKHDAEEFISSMARTEPFASANDPTALLRKVTQEK